MRPARRAALCFLACVALAACDAQEPLTDADKALFVRVADLSVFGVGYPDAEARESFSKAKQLDGAYELTYKFETASGNVRPLYMHVSATVGRTTTDAMMAETAEKVGLLVAFRKNGVQESEVPGIKAGRLALLLKDGQPIGNLFTLRDGSKTYLFIMSGLYVRDAETWQKLIAPKLEQLARYQTKP